MVGEHVASDQRQPATSSSKAASAPFHRSFEGFYAEEYHSVVVLAYVLSGSRSGAEDLAQEAFLAAFRRWDTIGLYEDPGGWLRRVIINRSISRYRKKVVEAKVLLRLRGDAAYVVPQLDPSVEELWAAVRRLPKRQAQAVALRYLDGRSTEEIASMLGCSSNTVRTHLQRAKQALQSNMRTWRSDA